ncbi:helix-turn-helix domain-containing protein [Silvanigrella sp.]|jgi:putative transcriptional regulator|uniref:helix-turn-helix domain-containing protein n=1 Tax=Silvanigrella sp. TaxID=2024976 RepID=UPI0037CA426F
MIKKQKRNNEYFNEILSGLNEALDHAKGNKKLKVTSVKIHPVQDMTAKEISKLREKLSFSQAIFAEFLGVSKKTVEAWEYGKSHPNGAALRLLNLIDSDPQYFENKAIEKSEVA